MFRDLSMALLSMPESFSASLVKLVSATGTTCTDSGKPSSVNGLSVVYRAFLRSASVNESVSTITTASFLNKASASLKVAPCLLNFEPRAQTLSAAAFIATITSALSPGVNTPLPTLTWKPLTPPNVPCGARISAGKSGRVLISLPRMAESDENNPPVNCIPSPESPQNRTTILSFFII